MTIKNRQQNYINHFGFLLDASWSMDPHLSVVPKVADMQIQHWAEQSKIMDQETRVSVYTFSSRDNIQCLIYDKDVLRMPSIAGLYRTTGRTALCSAMTLAINDLKLTPEKYGEHSMVIEIVTDGMENDSSNADRKNLPSLIAGLPEHWTLGAFVPDASGMHFMKALGFPAGNIAIWNPNDDSGFLEVGELIRQSTDTIMRGRTQGVRGTRSLFTLPTVDVKDIRKTLTPMTPGSYFFTPITDQEAPDGKVRIDEFCTLKFGSYTPGMGMYELSDLNKRVLIQDYKKIAIYVPADQHLYVGKGVRGILGIPEQGDQRVRPGDHPEYKIFVQSTANNRNLFPGTDLLVMR